MKTYSDCINAYLKYYKENKEDAQKKIRLDNHNKNEEEAREIENKEEAQKND